MSRKNQICAAITCLFLFAIGFVSESPSHSTFARFTASASADVGIKLTLGNLDLGVTGGNSTVTDVTVATLKSGVALPVQALTNEGTLDGKLAYKITVEGTGGAVPLDVSFVIDGISYDVTANDGAFQFLGGADTPVILVAGREIRLTPKIKSAVPPANTEKLTVTISYRMVQSNATEATEKMFYDETETQAVLAMKPEEPITSPAVWPTDGWQTNANSKVKYNTSSLTNTHYYGDSAVNAGSLTFLDNPVIYLEFPPKKIITIHEKDLAIQGYKLEVVYDDKYSENGRVKIVYSLNSSADNNLYLIKNVHLRLNYTGGNITLYNGKISAKKLLLSTDKPEGLYNTQYQGEFPIYASNISRSLYLAYINADYSNDLAQSAKPDITFRNYKMSIITSEKYVISEIDYANNAFGIYANASHNQTGDAGTAEIWITGNSNEPLVIRRAVKTLRTQAAMIIPEQWIPLTGGVSINAPKLPLNLKTTVKDGKEYLVSDEANPPALYFKNAGSHFFGFQLQGNAPASNGIEVKDIVYSSDLSILKVTFSYAAPKSTSYDGYNMDITNGVNNIVNGHYIQYDKAIQADALKTENVTAVEMTIQSETAEGPEAEGSIEVAVDETEAIMAEPETAQASQNQTEAPAAVAE